MATVAAATSLLAAACVSDVVPAERNALPFMPSQPMIAYVAPPASPPSASLGASVLQPTMVQWRVEGDYIQSDISQEDTLPVNDAPVSAMDVLVVQISEINPTAEVKLRVFDTLAENGYPNPGDIGTAYACDNGDTSLCSVSFNKVGGGAVHLRPAEHNNGTAALYVLQAFYPTAEDIDMDANITDYTISWALRDAPR